MRPHAVGWRSVFDTARAPQASMFESSSSGTALSHMSYRRLGHGGRVRSRRIVVLYGGKLRWARANVSKKKKCVGERTAGAAAARQTAKQIQKR